jgi:5-methyltetrahydrofolate--homocysteine methyltransferase
MQKMKSYLSEVDLEKITKRFDAFWEREIIDRPLISIKAPRPGAKEPDFSVPDSPEKRWTDPDYILNKMRFFLENTLFLGDAIPFYMPNIGPDSFTAYLGGNLQFLDERTSWVETFVQNLREWEPIFDRNNRWWQFMNDLIDAVCEEAEGCFLVGVPDLHGGGDSLAAARGPSRLALDLYDRPDEVRRVLKKLTKIYYEVYETYYDKISKVQEGSITWLPAYSRGKFTALQNDFSGLVSPEMFREFFLYEIEELSRYLDNSIYHLDGPSSLGNLDYLLEIDTLDGIQWVPGAGAKPMSEWVDVSARILDAGKCLQIGCKPEEVEFLLKELKPQGLFISTNCATEEEAQALLKRVEKLSSV